MQLTSLQLSTVNDILKLYNSEEKVICEFKAPTGSGKTLMASYFISSMINDHPNDNFIFVIATPSSSSLPAFFEQKINKYKTDLPFSKFNVEYIQSPSSTKSDKTEALPQIMAERNKVYIFGKASFGKGRILSEYKIIDDFIASAIDRGYKLIYIRDEAHIGGEKVDSSETAQNFEKLMITNASFVLKMTATPDFSLPTKKVVLKESQLNNPLINDGKWLLKTHPSPLLDHSLEDSEILKDAILKFKKIKKEYEELNVGIRPAMLIQVDNSSPSNPEKAKEFHKGLDEIKKTLNENNISWVQYFGNNEKDSNRVYKNSFSLEDISQNNNDIDAIIFKIGPSTGWDIPRACMLLQLRKVSSQSLNIQTLGRIKRNPYPNLEKNPITDNYYIYSNKELTNADEIKEYNYKVRDKFSDETFLTIDISNKKEIKNSSSFENFKKDFRFWLERNRNIILSDVDSVFIQDGTIYKKVRSVINGNQIYSTIKNPFIFLRDYKRLLQDNKFIYDIIQHESKNFSIETKVQNEFIVTILLEKYKKDILDLIAKTRGCKPKYKIIEQKYHPELYHEVYSNTQNTQKVSKRDYLFEINEEDKINPNQQPLDSNPEVIIFNKIHEFAEDNEKSIRLWAKNQTTSNIFGEYLDETLNIRKSFFDFIIKFENEFYLYIEVKAEKDINVEKTKQLKEAYSDYFENREENLFSKKLAILICVVDEKGNVRFANSIFYDKNAINENIEKFSFENLLSFLASI